MKVMLDTKRRIYKYFFLSTAEAVEELMRQAVLKNYFKGNSDMIGTRLRFAGISYGPKWEKQERKFCVREEKLLRFYKIVGIMRK